MAANRENMRLISIKLLCISIKVTVLSKMAFLL